MLRMARVSKDGRAAHGSRRRARARLLTMRFSAWVNPFHQLIAAGCERPDHFVSGQPLSAAVGNALSPGTVAIIL